MQGEQLWGLLGPRRAGRLAPPLHAFVPQVGHPQGVQQGDYVGEQLRLQKPKTEYRVLILSHPVLSLPSVGGRLGGSHRETLTVVVAAGGGLVGFLLPLQFHLLIPPLQPPNRHRLYVKDRVLAANPAATQGKAAADPFLTT